MSEPADVDPSKGVFANSATESSGIVEKSDAKWSAFADAASKGPDVDLEDNDDDNGDDDEDGALYYDNDDEVENDDDQGDADGTFVEYRERRGALFACKSQGCGYITDFSAMKKHSLGHGRKRDPQLFPVQCQECDWATTNAGTLQNHKRYCHSGKKMTTRYIPQDGTVAPNVRRPRSKHPRLTEKRRTPRKSSSSTAVVTPEQLRHSVRGAAADEASAFSGGTTVAAVSEAKCRLQLESLRELLAKKIISFDDYIEGTKHV
jgi:hypothetical protein